MSDSSLERRALRISQDPNAPLYLFTLRAREIAEIADVARIGRDTAGDLIGYQRPEKRKHVLQIQQYLDSGQVLFPHALILALPPEVKFTSSRGPSVSDGLAQAGTLEIPLPADPTAPRPAWIVDGQQRSLALARTTNVDLAIPVAGFVAPSLQMQREQFLRVNTVLPLPANLVTELLPTVPDAPSPRMSARRLPSALVDLLNTDSASPFAGLIKRASTTGDSKTAVVTDTGLVEAIKESLESAAGVLFSHRNLATGTTDTEAIRRTLILYWTAVRDTFPDAWGRPASESRLMHGAGIRAMGRLMDRVVPQVNLNTPDASEALRRELELIAPMCCWTAGRWQEMDIEWREVQNTPRHISALSNLLVRTYVQRRDRRR